MRNNFLTNEQKLDYLYETIKKQEARQIQARWFHIIKWTLIIGFIYTIATHPMIIVNQVTAMMRPFIIENVKSMTNTTKASFLEEVKKVLQENQ